MLIHRPERTGQQGLRLEENVDNTLSQNEFTKVITPQGSNSNVKRLLTPKYQRPMLSRLFHQNPR